MQFCAVRYVDPTAMAQPYAHHKYVATINVTRAQDEINKDTAWHNTRGFFYAGNLMKCHQNSTSQKQSN
jgi:hypothetical protein